MFPMGNYWEIVTAGEDYFVPRVNIYIFICQVLGFLRARGKFVKNIGLLM
jgi:hypothetical protein